MERDAISDKFPLGSKMPQFSLKNIDGAMVSQDFFAGAKAKMVLFTCNHCPYVKGSDEMLLKIVRRYETDGLKTVAISSNDAVQYPEDSFEKMGEKAKSMKFSFPYLYDESQEIAKRFDAACTPEIYLFDASDTLVFHGTVNNNPRNPDQATSDYLSPAIAQVLEGQQPEPAFVHPIGCSIKWR